MRRSSVHLTDQQRGGVMCKECGCETSKDDE